MLLTKPAESAKCKGRNENRGLQWSLVLALFFSKTLNALLPVRVIKEVHSTHLLTHYTPYTLFILEGSSELQGLIKHKY